MVRVAPGGTVNPISKWVLFLTHNWTDLTACSVDETECVLRTLLRWASCTRGTAGLVE